jgi:hypothetical protein
METIYGKKEIKSLLILMPDEEDEIVYFDHNG